MDSLQPEFGALGRPHIRRLRDSNRVSKTDGEMSHTKHISQFTKYGNNIIVDYGGKET